MLQESLGAFCLLAFGVFPASVWAQSSQEKSKGIDEVLGVLASDERLTWQHAASPSQGGPNADFSLTNGDITAEPSGAAAPAAAAAPESSDYGPKTGNVEFTLSGSGVSEKHFHTGAAAVTGSLGYFLTDAVELAARQDFVWVKSGHSETAAISRGALDFHVDLEVFQPFIGVNLGYAYGELVKDTWVGGPEGGLKVFIKPDAFVFGLAEYRVFFRNANEFDEAFNHGEWVYSVGIGLEF